MDSEWWSVFRTARRALFGELLRSAKPESRYLQACPAVIAVLSVLWSILLSVYIAREWKHAVEAQRESELVCRLKRSAHHRWRRRDRTSDDMHEYCVLRTTLSHVSLLWTSHYFGRPDGCTG